MRRLGGIEPGYFNARTPEQRGLSAASFFYSLPWPG
nr:MAG TPA: hypothetical protein [Caudoviricetes sp.]DAY22043.1 MAG TPA: hypothetical protein [Caudoviricetes sp.]